MTEPVRLAKRLAAVTGCSRREAELYIEGGWVLVDGRIVDEPRTQVTDQQVALRPGARAEPIEPASLLLHKPAGMDMAAAQALLGEATRSEDDPTGIHLLQRHFSRLEAPLPLPPEASGMVLFTQDWRMRRRMTDDADRIEQECIVEVAGQIAEGGLALLAHGLRFNDSYALPPIKVSWQNERHLRFAMKIVQPAQIPAMCEAVGLRVLGIRRIRMGRIPLARLAVGQWRYLDPQERL